MRWEDNHEWWVDKNLEESGQFEDILTCTDRTLKNLNSA